MDPADYPFAQPDGSQLVLAEGDVPIVEAPEGELIAKWVVRNGDELLPLEAFVGAQYAPLLELPRRPVIAYGSNANSDVLREKLADHGSIFVPMLRGRLQDFDVVYSAHISPTGAIPATLCESPGTRVTVFVLLLDVTQLAAMDATEPNYDRLPLTKSVNLTLDLGPSVDACVYASKHGALNVHGVPCHVEPIPARLRRFDGMTERQVLELARERLGTIPGGEREGVEAQTRTLKRDSLPTRLRQTEEKRRRARWARAR
jgi:hypothetical protein